MAIRRRSFVAVLLALLLLALPSAQVAAAAPPSKPAGASGHAATGGAPVPSPPGTVELPALRTSSSRTYRSGDHLVLNAYAGSVNYQDLSGAWQPIDDTLVAGGGSGYAWQNKANRYVLRLPAGLGQGPVHADYAGRWVEFQLQGVQGGGKVSGSTATYANALPGVDVSYSAGGDGIKEELRLASAQAPSSFSFALKLSSGLTARANGGGGIDLLDASGRPYASFGRPFLQDSSGTPAGRSQAVSLALGPAGTLTLTADRRWLADPARRWPVAIDPTLFYTADQDCYITSGQPDTNFCGGSTLEVGYDGSSRYRSLLQFSVQSRLAAASVLDAKLEWNVRSASTGNLEQVGLYPLTRAWTAGVTWNRYDGTNAWATPGGDFSSSPAATLTPQASGEQIWSGLRATVQGWVDNPGGNDGLLVKAVDETVNELYTLDSTNGQQQSPPHLEISYVSGIGRQPFYRFGTHRLTDRLTSSVNVGDGNLVLEADDLSIRGTGLNLNLRRYYNSETTDENLGAFGAGWTISVGPDVHLAQQPSGDVAYFAPDGHAFLYALSGGSYQTPAGVNARLQKNPDSSFKLTFNGSSEVYNFSSAGQFSSDKDRNGNTISFAYNANGSLATITDTQGRQLSFGYTSSLGATLITQITDSSGRSWSYSYTGTTADPLLQGYTDPDQKLYQFTYPTNQLQVTDPLGHSTLYGLNIGGSVGSASYGADVGGGFQTTYAYASDHITSTDPKGHATSYYFDSHARITKVVDALGHQRQSGYTANSDVSTLTDAVSQVSTLSYDTNNNLTQIQAPASAQGQTPASTSFSYQAPGQTFLPSSRTDPQGNCRAFTYDGAGNLTDVYDGQASPCSGQSGGTHLQNRYQGDPGISCGARPGELCSSTDGNGHTTSYGYDAQGNLTAITPPVPLGQTTIVPDALSRPASVTDGRGQKTSYTHDNLDRITQILYGGAGSCSSPAVCTSFSYDADGNLSSRTDAGGSYAFSYDQVNRLILEQLPDTSSACSGSSPAAITFAYDAVGNLTSYCDAGGTIAYGYDAANRMTALAEPGGTLSGSACATNPCSSFQYDNDDRRTQATFPGGATLQVVYDNAGNQTSAVGKSSSASVLSSFAYTYTVSTKDTALRQTVSEQDAVFSGTTGYGYDAFNRLTSATNTRVGNLGYAYDAAGNRTSDNSGSYSYNAADELTASPGVASWSYDGTGNLTGNSAGASISYNAQNQSTAITYGGQALSPLAYADVDQTERTQAGSTSYASSGLGLQIAKSAGASTFYTRDSQGNLIGERLPDGSRWYYLKDGMGSVVAVINESGSTVANRYGYDPYGRSTYKAETVVNPWGYAGGYLDPTGLIKFGDRYYDPGLGRWTQQDAIAGAIFNPGGLNRYLYTACNPVNTTDPSGRYSLPACASGLALGVIGAATNAFFGAVFFAAAAEAAATVTLAAGIALAAAFAPLLFGLVLLGAGAYIAYSSCFV